MAAKIDDGDEAIRSLGLKTWRALMAAGAAAPAWFPTDNGFASVSDMALAHAPIVDAIVRHATAEQRTVIDLGCGNGALLAAICDRLPGLRPIGVERDADRLTHARTVLPGPVPRWHHADIFAWAQSPPTDERSVVLLMLGRLVEASPDESGRLKRRVAATADLVLGYAYSDWLARYGDLAALCRAVGAVPRQTPDPTGTIVAVDL